MNKQAIFGIFTQARKVVGFTNEEFKQLVLRYPEYIMQGKGQFLTKKYLMILKNTYMTKFYLKEMILRHPDILLGSVNSLQEKLKFLKYDMNQSLKQEEIFPICLKLNFNSVIRPRCQIAYK